MNIVLDVVEAIVFHPLRFYMPCCASSMKKGGTLLGGPSHLFGMRNAKPRRLPHPIFRRNFALEIKTIYLI